MHLFYRICFGLLLAGWAASLTACSPEVGSEEWCRDMKEKPTKEWTASEASDYTKYCILKLEKK